eukprot:8824889-Pyramimonas_sp.AAC.1
MSSMSIDGWKPRCTDTNSKGPWAEILAAPCLPLECCSLGLVTESTDESPSVKSNITSDVFLLGKLRGFGRLVEALILVLRSEGLRPSVRPSAPS